MKVIDLYYKGKHTTINTSLTIKPKAALITAGAVLLGIAILKGWLHV